MKKIRYLITYAVGTTETAEVQARTVNAGFGKALRIAREPLGNGARRDIHAVSFSEAR